MVSHQKIEQNKSYAAVINVSFNRPSWTYSSNGSKYFALFLTLMYCCMILADGKLQMSSKLFMLHHYCKTHRHNFRPVSHLNYVSKFMKQIVTNQIQFHMHNSGISNHLQLAYEAGYYIETSS